MDDFKIGLKKNIKIPCPLVKKPIPEIFMLNQWGESTKLPRHIQTALNNFFNSSVPQTKSIWLEHISGLTKTIGDAAAVSKYMLSKEMDNMILESMINYEENFFFLNICLRYRKLSQRLSLKLLENIQTYASTIDSEVTTVIYQHQDDSVPVDFTQIVYRRIMALLIKEPLFSLPIDRKKVFQQSVYFLFERYRKNSFRHRQFLSSVTPEMFINNVFMEVSRLLNTHSEIGKTKSIKIGTGDNCAVKETIQVHGEISGTSELHKKDKLLHRFIQLLRCRRDLMAINSIVSCFPLDPSVSGLDEYLEQSRLHSWNLINKRKAGVPGGRWHSPILSKALNNAGFYYFSVSETPPGFCCRIWSKYNQTPFVLNLYPDSQFARIWVKLLVNYVLSAITDMTAIQHFIKNPKPLLPRHSKRKGSSGSNKGEKVSIRYYPNKPSISSRPKDQQPDNSIRRLYHLTHVTYSVRRLPLNRRASEWAIRNAGLFNIPVPSGSTFVQPHTRGCGEDSPRKIVTRLWSMIFSDTIDRLLDI